MSTTKDDDAFYEHTCAELRGYARRWIPESELGDFVQDCMTVLVERRAELENRRAFLYAVARNKIKQFHDKRRRQQNVFADLVDPGMLSMESLSTSLSVRVARHNDLEEAMSKLRARQYAAFELRYVVGLTEADAAGVLEISTATLKRDLAQARAQLRELLGDSDDEQVRALVRGYIRQG